MTLLPERPEFVRRNLLSTFGSYTSKSSGNLTSGLESNFRLPVPEMTSLTVTASLVLTFVLLIEEVILNSPTPPENRLAYLPARALRQLSVAESKLSFNFYVIASSIENASNGSATCVAFAMEASKRAASIVSLPACCGNNTN